MPKVIKLKESDLNRIVKRVIKEGAGGPEDKIMACLTKAGIKGVVSGKLPAACAAAAADPKNTQALEKCMTKLVQLNQGDYVALGKLALSAVGCISGSVTKGGSGGGGVWDEKLPGGY